MQRLILVSLVVTGCVADNGGEAMQIRQILAPPDTGCSFDPASTTFLPRGTLYLNSTQPYLMAPLIESQITAVTGQESLRTVALRGARVDLEMGPISVDNAGQVTQLEFSESENAALQTSGATKFRSLFSAPLTPNGGLTTGSFDAVSLPALAAIRDKVGGAMGAVHAQVIAKVVVYGDLGGDEVESGQFVFPITVCNDCVLNFFDFDLNGVPDKCPVPSDTTVRPGNACNFYQDGVADCCLNDAGKTVCPAPLMPEA